MRGAGLIILVEEAQVLQWAYWGAERVVLPPQVPAWRKKRNCSTQHNSALCSFFPTKSWVDGWVSQRRALRSFAVGVFGRVCASACLLVCRRVFVCVSRAVWDCAGSGTYPARCFLDLSEMPSRDMSLLKTTIPMSMFTWREAQRTIWSGGRLKNGATLNFFYHRSHFFLRFFKKKKLAPDTREWKWQSFSEGSFSFARESLWTSQSHFKQRTRLHGSQLITFFKKCILTWEAVGQTVWKICEAILETSLWCSFIWSTAWNVQTEALLMTRASQNNLFTFFWAQSGPS